MLVAIELRCGKSKDFDSGKMFMEDVWNKKMNDLSGSVAGCHC